MNEYPAPYEEPERLISPDEVKGFLTATDPNYGKDLTDKEWSEITERLCALGRLIWKISERQLREELDAKQEPASE